MQCLQGFTCHVVFFRKDFWQRNPYSTSLHSCRKVSSTALTNALQRRFQTELRNSRDHTEKPCRKFRFSGFYQLTECSRGLKSIWRKLQLSSFVTKEAWKGLLVTGALAQELSSWKKRHKENTNMNTWQWKRQGCKNCQDLPREGADRCVHICRCV